MIRRLGAEESPAHGLTEDVLRVARALLLLDELELVLHLGDGEARRAFDPLELPLLFDLVGRARIGRLAVGLGAAAKTEEVIIERLVVRVDLRAALIARAFVPRSARVNAVELALVARQVERLARDDLVDVAGQVVHAVVAHAFGLAAVSFSLPEARQLARIARGDLFHVGAVPFHVAVAFFRVAHVPVGKREKLRPLAGKRPLGFGAQALADGGAFELGLMEAIHHLGPRALLVRPGVLVDAETFFGFVALAFRPRLELFADRFSVALVVPASLAFVLDVGAVLTVDQEHSGRASARGRRRFGCRGSRARRGGRFGDRGAHRTRRARVGARGRCRRWRLARRRFRFRPGARDGEGRGRKDRRA